jgi:hypothetical protein
VLLQAAQRHGRPEWEQAAREIIAFWVDRSGTGLCHTEWDRAQRGWVDPLADVKPGAVFLRDQSEARCRCSMRWTACGPVAVGVHGARAGHLGCGQDATFVVLTLGSATF